MSYTPGPWRVVGKVMHEPIERYVIAAGTLGIVDVDREDDARLISLAPEMAELLKEAADWLTQMSKAGGMELGPRGWLARYNELVFRIHGEKE